MALKPRLNKFLPGFFILCKTGSKYTWIKVNLEQTT